MNNGGRPAARGAGDVRGGGAEPAGVHGLADHEQRRAPVRGWEGTTDVVGERGPRRLEAVRGGHGGSPVCGSREGCPHPSLVLQTVQPPRTHRPRRPAGQWAGGQWAGGQWAGGQWAEARSGGGGSMPPARRPPPPPPPTAPRAATPPPPL